MVVVDCAIPRAPILSLEDPGGGAAEAAVPRGMPPMPLVGAILGGPKLDVIDVGTKVPG